MTVHRVLVVLGPDGGISGSLGAADAVVVADVQSMEIIEWHPHRVGWATDPYPARQQASVLAFVRHQVVEAVVAGVVSADLQHALRVRGVAVLEHCGISARAAAVSAATVLDLVHDSGDAGASSTNAQ